MAVTRAERVFKQDIFFKNDMNVTSSGDILTVRAIDNLRQAMFNRLVTRPGSVVHRPLYGVGIKDFQNAVGSIETKTNLMIRIQEQFASEERIEAIESLEVTESKTNPSEFTIKLRVKPVGIQPLDLEFDPFSVGV